MNHPGNPAGAPESRLRKRMRSGAFSLALTLAAALTLIGMNVLLQRLERDNGWQRDLSFNSVTSYGEVTDQTLRALAVPVKAYVLYQDDPELLALLDRYAAATTNFSWEAVDIALNPSFLNRYRTSIAETSVSTDCIVFDCAATGRFRVVRYESFLKYSFDDEGELQFTGVNYESAITYAIRYVTRETSPRAVFLHGHGEMDETETEALAYLLSRHFYDVVYASLGAEQLTLGEEDVILILSPTMDISDGDLRRLNEYAEAGGSFVFAIDWTTPVESMPNLCALMQKYGIEPRTGLVVADEEDANAYYEGYPYYLIPALLRTEASAVMVENGSSVLLLPGSSAFATPEYADPYLYTDVLLSSGSDAYLIPADRDSLDRQENDPTGPFALSLLALRITERAEYSRAFAIGCSTALTSTEVFARTDNQELIMRVMGWLAGESEYLGIESKDAVRPQLSVRSVGLGSAVVFMLPIAVAAAAIVVLGIRRRH